jgi:Cyclic-phosphate processing Receiver domain
MRIWLDDVRDAPQGWIHITTPEEAIELLRSGEVEEISLDHDLGLATSEAERTGYDVLVWLEEAVAIGAWNHALPVIRIHSANPVGQRRMEQAIESIRHLSGLPEAEA